jgi:DNA-binding NtrC family response regulator
MNATPERILVVEDSPATREMLARTLAAAGYEVRTAPGAEDAIALLGRAPSDLVITDLKMPGPSGLSLVRHVRENLPDAEVMMVTGYATVSGAVEAVKCGAEEYLAKPFTEEELLGAVGRVIGKLRRRRAARADPDPRAPQGLLGKSEAMKPVFRAIARAADSDATVFVSGESGTGKELVARAIHYGGRRASAPFVAVNCGAIPEGLLETELFGYVRGAFTGATESRAGFFQTADGGTIFLDEVSETSPAMQVKLLRVLQDKEVLMVGANLPRLVDVRIVASTNRDAATLVAKCALREDLFYRLNVIPIRLPPLRERGDDVLLLADTFARKFAEAAGRAAPVFTPEALRALADYTWPGNVRELENLLHNLVVMLDGDTIEVSDLPPALRYSVPREGASLASLAEVESRHLRTVLAACGGNRTQAAKILGIDRKTLREKLKGAEGPVNPPAS